MISIEVQGEWGSKILRQLPYAVSRAINDCLTEIKSKEIEEMKRVFDRPTPYTLNSLYTKWSNKTNLTGIIGTKDTGSRDTPAAKFLGPAIFAGERGSKRFENALRAVGVLPAGMFIQPGRGAKIDSYGNISRGQINQILSYFRAFREAGYKANITEQRRLRLKRGTKKTVGYEYFVGRPGGGTLPLGIWHRTRTGQLTLVFLFSNQPVYRKRFQFYEVAEKVVADKFSTFLWQRLEGAL